VRNIVYFSTAASFAASFAEFSIRKLPINPTVWGKKILNPVANPKKNFTLFRKPVHIPDPLGAVPKGPSSVHVRFDDEVSSRGQSMAAEPLNDNWMI